MSKQFHIQVESIFDCSLERAFKTPMLCDVRKVHTGFIFSPKVTGTTEDESWGQVGSSKKIHAAKSITHKGGYLFIDRVIEREENKYWKIQMDTFQSWMVGFDKFEGEWHTEVINANQVQVKYKYTFHAQNPIYFPLNWVFIHAFWRYYMKRVIANIKTMAYNEEPYLYD